jgi:hypothetical protein
MGGLVSMMMFMKYPEIVQKLVMGYLGHPTEIALNSLIRMEADAWTYIISQAGNDPLFITTRQEYNGADILQVANIARNTYTPNMLRSVTDLGGYGKKLIFTGACAARKIWEIVSAMTPDERHALDIQAIL